MFKKLNNEIKKNNLKEEAKEFLADPKNKRAFEKELIFGDLLESLDVLDLNEMTTGGIAAVATSASGGHGPMLDAYPWPVEQEEEIEGGVTPPEEVEEEIEQ